MRAIDSDSLLLIQSGHSFSCANPTAIIQSMKPRLSLTDTGKAILKSLTIYAAAAWGLLQVVEFAVENYGLSRFLLDSAVITAFGGGMITAVLAWYHGAAGSQSAQKSEIAIIGTVILGTIIGILFLAQNDPARSFERLDGFRLVFELRDPLREDGFGTAGAAPPEGWHWMEDGGVHLNPEDGEINWPYLSVSWEEYPVRIQNFTDKEYFTVTIVLPFEPKDLSDLLSNGPSHTSAQITSTNLEISIRGPFEVSSFDSGISFSFEDF